jgi:Ca-activated chloride channel homolog
MPYTCRCGRGGFINPINFIVSPALQNQSPTVLHLKS